MTASVSITDSGRDGAVRYAEGAHAIDGYWCFGGGDVVAIVSMGSREDWRLAHPWALERRAAILQFVAAEVRRRRAPSCTVEVDEQGGEILLRQPGSAPLAAPGAAPPAPRARAAGFVRAHARLRSMLGSGLLVVAAVVGSVFWVGSKLLYVAPASGVPLNASVRTDSHIASLIRYTDPHLPEISGRGGNTTTSIAILLIPLDGSAPRVVPVVRKLSGGSYDLARIMGSDGRTLWFDATGLFGVRLSDYQLVTAEQLREANPTVDPRWWQDPRGMDVIEGRLHVVNDDRSAALDVDPGTLRATPAKPQVDSERFHQPDLADFLAAGFLSDSGSWFGVHATEELKRDFAPRAWVRPVERAVDARRMRRFYGGATEASSEGGHRRILGLAPLGDAEFLDAALLRTWANGPPLRLAAPDSALMVFTSGPGRQGTLVVARVDLQGRVIWKADTGLDRFLLQQILPGKDGFAFVGTRPPIPDKLSEPLVVLVHSDDGSLTSHSLWR